LSRDRVSPSVGSRAMRRTVRLLAVVLLVLPLLGSDLPKEYDGVTERDDVQGTWELVEWTFDGQSFGGEGTMVTNYRFGTKVVRYWDSRTITGRYRTDPTRTPPSLDEIRSDGDYQGQAIRWIYRVEGDTLRIAHLNMDPTRRPQTFHDKDVR